MKLLATKTILEFMSLLWSLEARLLIFLLRSQREWTINIFPVLGGLKTDGTGSEKKLSWIWFSFLIIAPCIWIYNHEYQSNYLEIKPVNMFKYLVSSSTKPHYIHPSTCIVFFFFLGVGMSLFFLF